MPWIDPEGNQYSELPKRVRLSDKSTRTADAVTQDLILEEGWVWQDPPVEIVDYTDTILSDTITIDSNFTSNVSL